MPHHRAEFQPIEVFAVHSGTYDARRVPHDEGHRLLAHGLRREDQIALVFSISIVRDDDGPAVPHFLEGLFYGLSSETPSVGVRFGVKDFLFELEDVRGQAR